MTFDEARKVELSGEDRRALARLASNDEWAALRRIVEGYSFQLTRNLLLGMEVEQGKRYTELDRLSGFSYYWQKVVNLVENKDSHRTDEEVSEEIN